MDERELLRAKLQETPRKVFLSIMFAGALATFMAIRILWTYQQAGKPLGRGLFYAGLIVVLIVSNSLSLLNKNKLGYVIVLIAGLLPSLGSLALSLHAVRLLVVGNSAQDAIGIVASAIGLLQLLAIIGLMVNLLNREVRNWIWKTDSPSVVFT